MFINIFNANLLLLQCSIVFVALCTTCTASSKILRVNCGSVTEKRDSDGHKWEPDAKYIVKNFSKAKSYHQDASIVSVIPYMDARIFHSKVSYKFPVVPGTRYFIRLYFYPTEYYHLNISDSYFSVQVDGITLLKDFNALSTAQARGQAFIVKEYSLAPSDSDTLDIHFNPSGGGNSSFAFVNGIELAPINGRLFGLGAEIGQLGQLSMRMVNTNVTNMETMYRLNVGGQFIPPKRDSGGLGRAWFNDDPFLQDKSTGFSLQAGGQIPFSYNKIPKCIAPVDVYSSARTMGENSLANLMFNLTWVFEVDVNFTYMLRFHFCDFILSKPNQVAFNIYVNGRPAQCDPRPADVISWTGKPGEPIYKDYVVSIDGTEGNRYIQVDLHPSTKTNPEFYDAQLSGLEIFKISDDNQSLAGPNADLTGKKIRTSIISEREMVVGATAGIFFTAALFVVASKKKERVISADMDLGSSGARQIYGTSHVINTSSRRSKVNTSSKHSKAQSLCRRFALSEMKQATKNFKESNVIGVGGFGNVYKGHVDENEKVAIKRSNPYSEQGIVEFDTEIEMLSRLRHKHLVSLIGFCEEEGEKILVYDFMSNGTLSDYLHNPKQKKTKLMWIDRLEICIGAARGLHYLHTGATHTIIHRDVKTTNILLDEHLVAKVSDFGLSKVSYSTKGKGHAISTVVKGSFGYLDPEYFRKRRLTEKSDVYAFGVVLFEVLCRRPAVHTSLPTQQMNLAEWALRCHRNGTLEEIIDPEIKETINAEGLKKYMETALKCLSEEGSRRPAMSDVLWNLEYVLQLQEVPDSSEISVTRMISQHGDRER